jgi:acyl-CoA synthetase (AMP-forming)/AMP-acid ligase II
VGGAGLRALQARRRAGAIDPGLGRAQITAAALRLRPRGFIGIPLAHALRLASPRAFRSVEVAINSGSALWRPRLADLAAAAPREPYPPAVVEPDEAAAVLFTSGSTGPPKGVVYTYGMFAAQVEMLRALYGMRPGDVDLACFPLFALFGAALGLTTVLPAMDFARPAACDPAEIANALLEHRATQAFGSPAIWRAVLPHCGKSGITFPSLERLLIAGAPVPLALVEGLRELLPRGDVHTPYGATEALPVTSISGAEILARRQRVERGEGSCVGRPVPGVDLCLIEIDDRPIASWSQAREVPPGEPGEICVRGAQVTRAYEADAAATELAKIADGPSFWHRMGDVGRLDGEGYLWFQGRMSHRLETPRGLLMPVGLENAFDRHPRVRRSALVGVGPRGAERPVLVVEPDGSLPRGRARAELATEILRATPPSAPGIVQDVLFKDALPVDVRHNAKIERGALKRWAERRLARR